MSTVAQPAVLRGTSVRRARVMGILFILVGVLILVAFGLGTEGGAASRRDEPGA